MRKEKDVKLWEIIGVEKLKNQFRTVKQFGRNDVK